MGSVLSFWEDLRQKVLAIVKLRSSVGVFELAKRITVFTQLFPKHESNKYAAESLYVGK